MCRRDKGELRIIMFAGSGFCNFDITNDNDLGEYSWNETPIGDFAPPISCTFGGFNGMESTATRLCSESLQDWEGPNLDMCFTEVTSNIQLIGEVSFTYS